MANFIDDFEQLLSETKNLGKLESAEKLKEYEQKLINYVGNFEDLEIFNLRSSHRNSVIDLALQYRFEDFLCLVIEKHPILRRAKCLENVKDRIFLAAVPDEALAKFLTANETNSELKKTNYFLGSNGCCDFLHGSPVHGRCCSFLHIAAVKRLEKPLIKALELYPSLAKIINVCDRTFLNFAARYRLENVCMKALEVYSDQLQDQGWWLESFLHDVAAARLEKPLIKALKIDQTLAKRLYLLHEAAANHLENVLLWALETNIDLATIPEDKRVGYTFLHRAAFARLDNVLIRALELKPDLAKIQDRLYGFTFLHCAGKECLDNVLDKAAKINKNLLKIKDKDDCTPVNYLKYYISHGFSTRSQQIAREKAELAKSNKNAAQSSAKAANNTERSK